MNSQLFRKSSIDRVSSPEQLNSYIRVSNPGVWLVLAAVVLLLLGVCAWGVLGHLDTTVSAAAVSAEGQLTIYVNAQDGVQLEAGMPVRIGDGEFTVAAVGAEPVTVDEGLSDYALYVGGLQRGQWVYTLTVTGGTLPDGVYEAQIVVESVAPMSFVTN